MLNSVDVDGWVTTVNYANYHCGWSSLTGADDECCVARRPLDK